MRVRGKRWACLAIALAGAAGGVGASGALGSHDSPTGHRAAADADARVLLAKLSLPAGASRSTDEPAGDGSRLAHPAEGPPATPNVVDEHAFWTAPGAPDGLLAYLAAHRPAGSRAVGSGHGSDGVSARTFAWRPIRGVLGTRWLVVAVVRLADGSTGVRADAQVVWLTPRPRSERIPASARRLRVTVRRFGSLKQGPIEVTARRRIRGAVRLLDALPAEQPGTQSCPMDTGVRVRLRFSSASGRTLAVAIVNPGGCQDVRLRLRGRPQPPLTSAAFPGSGRSPAHPLVKQLDRALGVRLRVGR